MAIGHRDVAGLLRKHGYIEVKKIGEGSFGKAILVKEEKDGGSLVCKMVDVSSCSAKETQDAVKESRLLSQFKHPYIVRYRESFCENGWLCILMDYCEGGDLTKQVENAKKKRQPISEDQILTWVCQALLALKYIHEKHVLHRDLKSGNFFLSKNGQLKVGDFGIAKVLSSTAACARTQIGTPYYLSPEVCQEKPYAWASDIWAMGCILYELCELKMPFDAPNISGLVQKIVRGPTPLISAGYSSFVRNLCSEMLNKNPNLRPNAENILGRSEMQSVVRRLLEERRAQDGDKEPSSRQASAPSSRQATPASSPGRPSGADRPSSRQNTPSSSPSRNTPSAVNRQPSRGREPSRGPSGSPPPAARGPSPGPGVRPPGIPRAPSPGVAARGPSPGPNARGPQPSRLANAGGMAVRH